MKATLELNLGDALNAEELRELTEIATRERKSLERVLYEAAKALVTKVTTSPLRPAEAAVA